MPACASSSDLTSASDNPASRVERLLVPGRACGSCTLCCKVFRIPEVDKLPGEWCRHVVQGGGCGIHATRPDVCRTFFCHYLRNPNLGPEWKPERSRFVLYTEVGGRRMVVAADQAAPTAWRKAPYYAQLRRWAALGLQHDRQVLVFNGKRATAVLPDRDHDLGTVEVGDEVLYHPGANGVRVELRRRSPAAG